MANNIYLSSLMQFLGLVGFYHSFCKNFSAVVAPLADPLRNSTKLMWSSRCQGAFENCCVLHFWPYHDWMGRLRSKLTLVKLVPGQFCC